MECGHKGHTHKGNIFVFKGEKPYQVQIEYQYCHKCKKKEISKSEKERIKLLIDEEEKTNEKK